jgi:hypothetical protein
MGDAPRAAIAGTASCMAASGKSYSLLNLEKRGSVSISVPSILPCSRSTMTQSTPVLARIRETLEPGSICQAPIAGRLPSRKTLASLLERSMLGPEVMVDRKRLRLARKQDGRLDWRQAFQSGRVILGGWWSTVAGLYWFRDGNAVNAL